MSNKHYIIPIFVPHIGCPHTCVFCNQDSITGDAGIQGSTGNVDAVFVKETIDEYLETINNSEAIIEVSFFGGTFTGINMCKQRELLGVAREYKNAGKIKFIRLSTRPDYINDEILIHLKNFGVDIIELGVQSLDEEVLYKSGRGHTAKHVEEASRLINEYGFTLGHQIMLGLPGDTKERDIATTKKSIEMKPSICRIYPSLVIKDTPMEKLLLEGKYKPYSLKESVDISKVVYGMLESSGINVIRIGLQPTEEINDGGDIVDGPFHPAYRELVEGSIYCDIIYEYIKDKNEVPSNIYINPKDISKLYANKKEYFNELLRRIQVEKLVVLQSYDLEKGTLGFYNNGKLDIINQKDYLKSVYNR
ncbi:MAG: radical SAM protein [Clostridium sp.]|uniref:elongator complex protein 3 n=1 Tax=Clostridium sp. TaxID=1506 RepID=UPI00304DC264